MAAPKDNVVREFQSLGRYRIRLLASSNGHQVLDIREYIKDASSFEGFTRRGIRITVPDEVVALQDVLNQVGPDRVSVSSSKGGKKR